MYSSGLSTAEAVKRRPCGAELENLRHVRGDRDFPRPWLKGSQDLCHASQQAAYTLLNGSTLLQRQKGGASPWSQSGIPKQTPPNSITNSESVLKKQ